MELEKAFTLKMIKNAFLVVKMDIDIIIKIIFVLMMNAKTMIINILLQITQIFAITHALILMMELIKMKLTLFVIKILKFNL